MQNIILKNSQSVSRHYFYVDFTIHEDSFINVFPDLDSAAQFADYLMTVDGLVSWRLLDIPEFLVDSYQSEACFVNKPCWIHETESIYENKKENEI